MLDRGMATALDLIGIQFDSIKWLRVYCYVSLAKMYLRFVSLNLFG